MRRHVTPGRSGGEHPKSRHPRALRVRAASLRLPSARWASLLALAAVVVAPSTPASADEEASPTTAVLLPASIDGEDHRLVGAVERVLRTKMDDLQVVKVMGTPALGLSDLQLAVGCVGETDACLKVVAEQLEVEALLLSSIEGVDGALMLTVTFFDARNGERRSAMRREAGEAAAIRLLEGVEPILREMFGLAAPRTLDAGLDNVAERRRRPALPFVVGGVGLATLLAGGATALVARRTHDQYASVTIDGAEDAEQAAALLDRSRRQARAAQGLVGVGGALAISGIVLFFVTGRTHEQEPGDVTVLPSLGPDGAGLHLAGRFGGAR
jgi:hypothetical protein